MFNFVHNHKHVICFDKFCVIIIRKVVKWHEKSEEKWKNDIFSIIGNEDSLLV